MAAAHVVFLIGITLAILAVALFLITVVFQLSMVWQRLNIVLGVVEGVVERTAVLDPIVSDIKGNLAAGEAAVVGAVGRLKERKGYTESSDALTSGPLPSETTPIAYQTFA